MSTAYDRGWGDPGKPGSATASKYRADHIVKVTAGGVSLYVRAEVARLFVGLIDELVASGYRLDVNADDWGYSNRNIRGYEDRTGMQYKSNHSWGLAVDLNSSTNPMTQDGHTHTDMPVALVRHLAAKWGLEWGGDYHGARRDPMHFEFLGRPGDEDIYPLEDHAPQPDHHNTTPEPPVVEEESMFYVIGYHAGSGRWLYFPQTNHKALITDGAALAEAQQSKGYGGYLEMSQDDLRGIQYLNPAKDPAA